MKQFLTPFAVLALAAAAAAQQACATPCISLFDDALSSAQTTQSGRAVAGPLTRRDTARLEWTVLWLLPIPGGDHPITPPVPNPPSPKEGDVTPVDKPTSGPSSTPGGSSGPSAPAPSAGRGPAPTRTGNRGTPLDALDTTNWTRWWAWNRGVFELPERRVVAPVVPGRTAVPVDGRPRMAVAQLCRSTSALVRVAAVQALGRMGAPVDELLPFLNDPAREVRLTALLAIGSGGTAAHAHALASWLATPQQGEAVVAALAGFALLEEGPAQRMLAPSVASLLTDSRLEVQAAVAMAAAHDAEVGRTAARNLLRDATTMLDRAFAAQVLGRNADDADVAVLTELSAARNTDVRRSAALALGRSHHAAALKALEDALERERDVGTRSYVLLALGDHRGDGAEKVLLREITKGPKTIRAHAALALGVWGHGRDGTDPLARAVADALADERNRDQKGAYLLALGLLRHEPSRLLVVAGLAVDESSPTRSAAATALGLLGGDASLEPLTKALATDSCPGVRQMAARAMASLGTKALDTLIDSLRTEKDGHVRAGALWALGSFDHAKAIAALLASAVDEAEPVDARAAAALSLGRAFRKHEPRMPEMRFQRDNVVPPPIVEWAFGQEL